MKISRNIGMTQMAKEEDRLASEEAWREEENL